MVEGHSKYKGTGSTSWQTQPHLEWKDSSVKSVESASRNWGLKRLKWVCRLQYGDSLAEEARESGEVHVFGSNGPVGNHSTGNTMAPCIVIGRKGSFGKVNYSHKPVFAIDTTFFVDERHTSTDIRWLYFILKWMKLDDFTRDAAVPGLDREETHQRLVPVPPRTEQSAMVRFLDHADRRIRRYIRAKQKLIALLEEQKQVIIYQAVTGQFDARTGKPYTSYREVGCEGLERLPKDWDAVPLKRVLERIVDCEHKTAPAVPESQYYVIRTTAVRSGVLEWDGAYCTDNESFSEWTRRAVPRPGDIIFTREAPAGEACLVPQGRKVCLGQRTVLLRPDLEKYDPMFLVNMIYEGPPKRRIQMAAQGSTVGHFNVDDIGSMPVLLPSLEEQRRIVATISSAKLRIDRVLDQLRRERNLSGEFHNRLIADVVTGKLDVREAAKGLSKGDDRDEEGDDGLRSTFQGSFEEPVIPLVQSEA